MIAGRPCCRTWLLTVTCAAASSARVPGVRSCGMRQRYCCSVGGAHQQHARHRGAPGLAQIVSAVWDLHGFKLGLRMPALAHAFFGRGRDDLAAISDVRPGCSRPVGQNSGERSRRYRPIISG